MVSVLPGLSLLRPFCRRWSVPAAAFLVCLALLWIKRRRDSAIPVLGALCGLAWFLVFTLVWVRPVKALAGQTVTCTAVVETDADASYSESRLRGTLRLTEIDGRAANVKVQCASFPGESAGERFTAKFVLTELPDNKYRLSRQSKGVYLQAEYLGSYHPLDASRAPRFALYRLRQRWSATLRRWLPRQLDGIEAAMLLADKSRLDDSVQQAFRTAGVSHLLAVSGLHLALLCGLLGFGRKWKFYKPLILLRAAAALFYLLLTGMPVSVSRAGIVLLVALVGDFFLLPPDLLTSTSFAAILLGLQNAYAPRQHWPAPSSAQRRTSPPPSRRYAKWQSLCKRQCLPALLRCRCWWPTAWRPAWSGYSATCWSSGWFSPPYSWASCCWYAAPCRFWRQSRT